MSIELLSLDNIQELAHTYGYWLVFLGIALENTGIPLPGETIIIVGGFLAGSGELNYWLVLVTAIAGAVLGDNLGYWLGKVSGWQAIVKLSKFFGIPTDKLEEAREKFSNNAAKAVFFGRFITILRIFAGPLAGIAQMPYRQFLLCNLGGAAVWALTIVSLSFFLGELVSLTEIITLVSKLSFGVLIIVAIAIGLPLAIKLRTDKLS
ncbi:MAG: DedA family protein [Cyanobacteria bacterium J083]|nr:MAG: DedA family protein [Cyanobacteria bacterium J083]